MIKLKIENGVVTNTIRVDPDNVPAELAGLMTAPEGVGIGDLYDGNTFTKPALYLSGLAEAIRQDRDYLLASCDWTQTADAPVDQVEWQDYRQALRDIPQQAGFPTDITWPTKPE